MRNTEKRDFLIWLAERLVHVYGESENIDFVKKLRSLAESEVLPKDPVVEEIAYDIDVLVAKSKDAKVSSNMSLVFDTLMMTAKYILQKGVEDRETQKLLSK